jgi:hypothetical protein
VSSRRKRRGRQLTLDDGHDGALLDGGGALETVGVDSTEELRLEVHRVERVGGLIVVGLDLACVAHVRKAAEKKLIRTWRDPSPDRTTTTMAARSRKERTHPQAHPQDPFRP